MENIMELIRTRLLNGETPADLIKDGFKKTTVYSVKKKMGKELKEKQDTESTERDIFIALIVQEAVGNILCEFPKFDCSKELKKWKIIVSIASDKYMELTGKKPPEDFLGPTFKEPD